MKFIKLQYKNVIKKVLLTEDELTWDHLCELIMNSFSLKDKERILLKYIDFEKEEVIVSNNKALVSALNLYFVQKFIKFFVHYSGLIEHQNSQNSTKPNESIENSKLIQQIPSPNNPILVLNLQEIQEIFSSAFEEAKIFKYIQNGLQDLILKKNPSLKDFSNASIEYAVHSDYYAMADYFKTILTSTLHSKYDETHEEKQLEPQNIQSSQIPSIQISQKITENDKKKDASPKESEKTKEKGKVEKIEEEEKENYGLDHESSFVESIYEVVENKETTESSILADPAQFYSPNLKKSISEQIPKKKFVVVAVENNGKVNFTSRIDLINKKPELYKSISDISFDFLSFHQTLKPEKEEKNTRNNLNRYEFVENILQENENGLDKDLPAPYLFDK